MMPIRKNPLLVESFRLATNYAIASPPMNSSGDVYHYLAYLILCKKKKWYIPTVYIAFDDDRTKQQAERCVMIARQLGFIHKVIPIQINLKNARHANVRENQLREYMRQHNLSVINQKGVTALLACAYRKYGRKMLTRIFREGFLSFDSAHISSGTMAVITAYAQSRVAALQQATQKKIVILNNRVSTGCNAQQSLPDKTVNDIRNTVRGQGFELFILSTSGDELNTYKTCPATAAFYPGPGVETKYGKAYHLVLLNELIKTGQIYGVIGGTSGTLDIAAFLGVRCFNIHNFVDKPRRSVIQSQEYRILLQSVWTTIAPTWSIAVKDVFITWLHNSNSIQRLPEERKLTSRTNHVDRHPFTCFNDEAVTTCSKQNHFHPYQAMLDTITGNHLESTQLPEIMPWYVNKYFLSL